VTGWELWAHLWRFDAWAWWSAGAAVVLCAFFLRAGARGNQDWWRAVAVLSAVSLFLLATASPLAVLAGGYLFSAQVAQQVLLLFAVPPLLLFCRREAESRADGEGEQQQAARSRSLSFVPVLCWMTGLGMLWLWQLPALDAAAQRSPWLFRLHVVSLLTAGGAFYWPVLAPRLERRLAPAPAILYLVAACLACAALGVWLTFSPASARITFAQPLDPLGVLPQLRTSWELTHALDRQVAGLVMWVPSCAVYLAIVLSITQRWLAAGASSRSSPAQAKRRDSHGMG
jgi:cytochrome c oxidase assembly factor CtaG